MDKEEILKEIEKTKKHLSNMQNMLEECDERWKPKDFSPYFYVDSCMKIEESNFYNDTYIHSERYNTYSTFKTKEEAELEAEKILVRRMLEDIARRLNKGQKIDWSDKEQTKYSICLDAINNEIAWDSEVLYISQGIVYCLDRNFYNVAIQEIGEERLIKYLRGE